MVQVSNPLTTDLTRIEPDDVEQPRPPDPPIRGPDDLIAVETGCDGCGCRWVAEYDVPEGSTVCGFCGVMRGYVGRNAKLSEFSDGHDDGPATISYAWAGTSPIPDWDTVLSHSRLLVQIDPSASFVDELSELVAQDCPYDVDVYLRTARDRLLSDGPKHPGP